MQSSLWAFFNGYDVGQSLSKVHWDTTFNWYGTDNTRKTWYKKKECKSKSMLVLIVIANQLGKKLISQFSASIR